MKIANQTNDIKTNNEEKQKNLLNFYTIVKVFVDLYMTLDSYASHLIKVYLLISYQLLFVFLLGNLQ